MSGPQVAIDLGRIERNARTIVDRCALSGIKVFGVTKGTCGMPQVPLVTPNTLMPASLQRSTMVRALRSMRPRSMATCGPDIAQLP